MTGRVGRRAGRNTTVRNTTMQRRSLLATAAFAASPRAVLAQTPGSWPTRPIRVILPTPPGGPAYVILRAVGAHMSGSLGQPLTPEHRPGAGGTIGAAAAAASPPDGYTLTMSFVAPHGVAPGVYPTLPYDPVRDFTHLALLAEIPLTIAVAAASPLRDLGQFFEAARRNPGRIRVGTPGNGTIAHVALEQFRRLAGIEPIHVPYRGGVPAVTDLIAGNIEATMTSLGEVGRNERLRILAVAAPARLPGWPDVPTFAEAARLDFVASVWLGLSAPAGLPEAISDRLHREAVAARAQPDAAERIAALGSAPDRALSRAAFTDFVAREAERWTAVARETGARAE
jgi:hypothetical protein